MESVVIVVVVAAAIFLLFKGLLEERVGDTITGKAYVIDGDTIKVSGRTIRLGGLDAPELDQVAKHQHGNRFAQGKRIKSALIRAIGGKDVLVTIEGYDPYDQCGRHRDLQWQRRWGMACQKRLCRRCIRRSVQTGRARSPSGATGHVGPCRGSRSPILATQIGHFRSNSCQGTKAAEKGKIL